MNQLQMQQSHLQLIVQHAIGSSGRLAVGLQSSGARQDSNLQAVIKSATPHTGDLIASGGVCRFATRSNWYL
jgi:hypothetical protein